MHAGSLAVAIVAMTAAAVLLLLPVNGRNDTVKPCGDELACLVPRYKSIFLSAVDMPAPFNGLNRVSVPVLALASLTVGVAAGAAAELSGRSDRTSAD